MNQGTLPPKSLHEGSNNIWPDEWTRQPKT